jgi:hypothetical protein
MSNALTLIKNGSEIEQVSAQQLESVLIQGDLGSLDAKQRVAYYNSVCASLGLNPLTKPFEYQKFQGKLILYARKDCTEQLRRLNKISVEIVSRQHANDIYIVTARAKMPDGRSDEDVGAVAIAGLKGAELANAFMKAETKAKRRATLSICGLGMLDESEIEDVQATQTPASNLNAKIESGLALPVDHGTEVVETEAVEEPHAQDGFGNLVVPFGHLKGQALADCDLEKLKSALKWAQEKRKFLDWAAKAEQYLKERV